MTPLIAVLPMEVNNLKELAGIYLHIFRGGITDVCSKFRYQGQLVVVLLISQSSCGP
jgi:hypothetical protein